MASRQITPQLFVQLYLESVAAGHTTTELSERLGWTYRRTRGRADYYRRKGVDLPKLADGRNGQGLVGREPLDVGGLNQMVDRFLLSKRDSGFDRRVRVNVPVNNG
jgi:hypothetical protein